MKEKDYTHCPREVSNVQLLRAEWLRGKSPSPVFIELNKDRTEMELKNHYPQKCFEFNNAGYFYLDDVAKALCTHYKDALFLDDEVYIRSILKSATLFDLAYGEFNEQYHRFMTELGRMDSRRCYVPKGDGGYYLMHPYIIVPESISLEEFKKLSKKEQEGLTNIHASKIARFHFYFARPLYAKYLDGGQYYQHPKNFFAKVWHIVSQLDINANKDGRFVAGRDYYPEINYNELLSSPRFVQGYIRFIDYLYEHGAGSHKSISIDEADMLKKCYPSLISASKDNKISIRVRDRKEYNAFFKMAVVLTMHLDGLDYKLKCPPTLLDESTNKLCFEFDHPQRVKEIYQNGQKN